jgi:hypothetical protein
MLYHMLSRTLAPTLSRTLGAAKNTICIMQFYQLVEYTIYISVRRKAALKTTLSAATQFAHIYWCMSGSNVVRGWSVVFGSGRGR